MKNNQQTNLKIHMEQIIQQQQRPYRIKDEIRHTSLERGGFGMVMLYDLMTASSLRRNIILQDKHIHPISDLQEQLGVGTP